MILECLWWQKKYLEMFEEADPPSRSATPA